MSEEDPEIEVKDRRRFLSEGGGTQTGGSTPPEEKDTAPVQGAEQLSTTGSEINFSSFVLSLSTQGLMCLGEVPDPQGGKPQQDLTAARQIIDILGMLKEKTTGNLHQAETQLLDHILFDLRMRYVKLTPR